MTVGRGVIIFGAASLARIAHYHISEAGSATVVGFAVDANWSQTESFCGLPVHEVSRAMVKCPPSEFDAFVAVGYKSMFARSRLFGRVKAAGYSIPNIVCQGAHVSKGASCGEGNFIFPGAVIEPWAVLGDNNTVWSNAVICHDSRIGSHNFIAAGSVIGGGCVVGSRSFFGFGSVVREGTALGDDLLVGAQSMVREDCPSGGRYIGVAARRVGEIDPDIGVEVD